MDFGVSDGFADFRFRPLAKGSLNEFVDIILQEHL